MFNPQSKLSAAAIFLAGVAAIAYTTLDIQRTLRSNEAPMTPEQLDALRQQIDHHDRKSAVAACRHGAAPFERRAAGLSQATKAPGLVRVQSDGAPGLVRVQSDGTPVLHAGWRMTPAARLQCTALQPLGRPRRRRVPRGRLCCHASGGGSPPQPDAHQVLGVSPSAGRAEIRAAYYARLQEVHPDVSGGDTTAAAVQLNLAYTRLVGDVRARSRDAEEADDRPSVFDAPEEEPTCIFVNPFACGVSPLQWRELQDLVNGAADPEAALQAAGLYFAFDSAVCWVTPAQLVVLLEELERMEATMSLEITGYYITDCLLRARYANDRVTYVRNARGAHWD